MSNQNTGPEGLQGAGQQAQQGAGDNRAQSRPQSQQQQAHRHDEGVRCDACGEVNPAGAKFCANCGAALGADRVCPRCAAVMPADGDICESCGTWLLEGQCPFCYAEIAPGAAFCGECGNPTAGVTCPNCGTVSIFDYCPQCYTALTEASAEMVQALAATPQAQEYFAAVNEVVAVQEEMIALQAEEAAEEAATAEVVDSGGEAGSGSAQAVSQETAASLDQLSQIAARRRAKKAAPGGNAGTPSEGPSPDDMGAQRAAAEEKAAAKKRAQEREAARAARREERARRLAELQARFAQNHEKVKNPPAPPGPLASNQEIRRYFMAVRPPNYQGWLCNAYNVIHQDPMHCTKPTGGGHWVTEIPPNLPIAPEGV